MGMSMKIKLFIYSMLVAMAGLSACSTDDVAVKNDTGTVVSKDSIELSFRVGLPGMIGTLSRADLPTSNLYDQSSLKDTTGINYLDEFEDYIGNIRVMIFKEDSTLVTGGNKLFRSQNFSVAADNRWVENPDSTVTLTFKVSQEQMQFDQKYHVRFVANCPQEGGMNVSTAEAESWKNIMRLSDLKAKNITMSILSPDELYQSLFAPTPLGLPMYGEFDFTLSQSGTGGTADFPAFVPRDPKKVSLERIVTKLIVTVSNYKLDENDHPQKDRNGKYIANDKAKETFPADAQLKSAAIAAKVVPGEPPTYIAGTADFPTGIRRFRQFLITDTVTGLPRSLQKGDVYRTTVRYYVAPRTFSVTPTTLDIRVSDQNLILPSGTNTFDRPDSEFFRKLQVRLFSEETTDPFSRKYRRNTIVHCYVDFQGGPPDNYGLMFVTTPWIDGGTFYFKPDTENVYF